MSRAPLRVLCLLAAALAPLPAQGGWWGDVFAEDLVPLEKILAQPEDYRGRRVAFRFQFERRRVLENPFHTRFETARYLNFGGWPDGAALWRRAVFEGAHTFFFAARGSRAATRVGETMAYGRFLARGVVRDVVAGKPWIEITDLEAERRQLTEPVLVHMMKGERLASLGRFDSAAREFGRAEARDLPLWVRRHAMISEIAALAAEGRKEEAAARVLEAWAIAPDSPRLAELAKSLGVSAPPPAPPAEEEGASQAR